MGLPEKKLDYYTYSDYYSWDTEERYELINGYLYNLAAPNRIHQEVCGKLFNQIYNFLQDKPCSVYIAPFDVRFCEKKNAEDWEITTVLQPDISVFCEKEKLDDRGAIGSPDIAVEVLSPSTLAYDLNHKLIIYQKYKVKEYWIVSPDERNIRLHTLDAQGIYTLDYFDMKTSKFISKHLLGFEIDVMKLFDI